MPNRLLNKFYNLLIKWLSSEHESARPPLCNFEQICFEIRQSDVLLIEGRSIVSSVIRSITQSKWTHSALYIGRLSDIPDSELRSEISRHYDGRQDDQLIIEAVLADTP